MDRYTYPGVYIQEVPSADHSIAGVATSIGAFVGWAAQGPTDKAVLVTSFLDFQRQFGGLDSRSLLGYAVSHFFNNGGTQTYIVRLAQLGVHRDRNLHRDQRIGERCSLLVAVLSLQPKRRAAGRAPTASRSSASSGTDLHGPPWCMHQRVPQP